MTPKSCKISLISVDSNIARITAFYVGVIFTLFVLTQASAIVMFLIVDFFTRIFFDKKYSLLFMLSSQTKYFLKLQTIKVDAAPKQLAAVFGLVFLVSILFLHIFNFTAIFYIFSAVLLACIVLEVGYSFCLGCEIYHIYKKLFV